MIDEQLKSPHTMKAFKCMTGVRLTCTHCGLRFWLRRKPRVAR